MRLPVDAGLPLAAIGLILSLAGCGLNGGGDRIASAGSQTDAPAAAQGPAADYPMVLGAPFTVEGELYTPAGTLNYDAVGYATLDEGAGVTAAHRTLPLPSYAEVTSLESGKTILVRIERRGPMAGKSLVALSPAAAAQLGAGEGAAIRLRRVNPPEAERAELRSGRAAPDRIATPKSLVEVLRRKLPPMGATSLASTVRSAPTAGTPANASAVPPLPPLPAPKAAVATSAQPQDGSPPASAHSHRAPARPTVASPVSAAETKPAPAAVTPAQGALVVQAAAFASRANAQRAAKILGGSVSASGKFFRVYTGPFASRSEADAALAKVRAAGYSDARVPTAR